MATSTGRNLNEYLLHKAIVGHRYTFEELNDRLNNLSQEKVELDYADESEYADGQDYALDFTCNTGYGTVFYLKTRTNQLFITEVSFTVDEMADKEDSDQLKAETIFVDIASQHEDYDSIIDEIRSLHSCEELTNEQYDYIISNWDSILRKYNL